MQPQNTEQPSAGESEALDPGAMFALLQSQQRSVESQLGGLVPAITASWGFAYLIGFLALWLIDGVQPAWGLPLPLAVAIVVIALATAVGVSAWLGIRSGRGIRMSSTAAFTGTVYGVTWSVGSIAIAAFGGGLAYNGMSPELANYFYPTAFVLFAGIMYLVAGAIWHAVPSVVAGAALVAVSIGALFLPYPWHYLFFALAGGAVWFVLSISSRSYLRRLRTTIAGDRNA